MAKKRKEKSEEEEFDFKLPKFDEKKFLKKERRNIKTLFLSFLIGLVMAIISFAFWVLLKDSSLRWPLVFLFGFINISWLKYVFLRLNIDLTDFGRKGWFSSGAIYFFTWLVLLIVLVNPPFYDEQSPLVEIAVLPGMQEPGGTVQIVAHIIDNVGVEKQQINFSVTNPKGTLLLPEFTYEDFIFSYTYDNPDKIVGDYSFSLKVTDVNGLSTTKEGTFEYSNQTLMITSSLFTNIRSGDGITIFADKKISENNFRVYYTINGEDELNVNRDDETDKEKYETFAEFEGWSENATHTVKVYAEVMHYFKNVEDKFSNVVEDTTAYNFTTGQDANIGTTEPLLSYNCTLEALRKNQPEDITINYALPCPHRTTATPGFEIIIFLLSLIIVAFLFKYRKR
jgi:hypothetical protein